MSAFIVSKATIDAIVTFAAAHRSVAPQVLHYEKINGVAAETKLGRMLLEENERSIRYRYPQTTGPSDMPGPVDYDGAERYFYAKRFEPIAAIEIVKLCDCLEYQSCEHPEWKDSEACRILALIRESAVMEIPGYDKAPWGLP